MKDGRVARLISALPIYPSTHPPPIHPSTLPSALCLPAVPPRLVTRLENVHWCYRDCLMSSINSLEATLQRLRQVRLMLLRLHKALLNSERIVYEQFHGRIQSSGEFFQLVIGHDWFSWLRPISQFIIQIDDVLSPKQPATLEQADKLLREARTLLQPAVDGTTLQKRYYRAIQRDPEIALMHAEMTKLLAMDLEPK